MKKLIGLMVIMPLTAFCSMKTLDRHIWLRTKILNHETEQLEKESKWYFINCGRIAGYLDCLEMIEKELEETKEIEETKEKTEVKK